MKKYIAICVVIASVAFAGCGPGQVVVRERPVAPVYVRPIAPSAGYVWIDGGWIRNGRNGYVYKQGYWVAPRPQYRNRPYSQGYWKQTRRGYVWVPGRW